MRRAYATFAVLAFCAGCMHTGKPSGPPPSQSAPRQMPAEPADGQALAAFAGRLKQYSELHEKLEKTLPPLPKETTPQIIDKHQRALAALVSQARKDAKRADLFTPDGERVIRRILSEVFSGGDGPTVKSTIMDENPVDVKLSINGRYPDEIPLSTVPPQVLSRLPKLPEQLEYRFIGPRLILLDVHAHIVADYIENVLPTPK